MKCTNATKVNRKSGVAQWRDLQFRGPFLEMFFERSVEVCGFFSQFSRRHQGPVPGNLFRGAHLKGRGFSPAIKPRQKDGFSR
jgi:hypothetical protein